MALSIAFCEALDHIAADGLLPPFEARLIRADGQRIDAQIHMRIAPDQLPPWGMCLVTYVDMTESKRLARDQAKALEAAEVAKRAKAEFLATIGHEIRTPLNGVLGMAQAMAFESLDPKAQRERLDVIRDSGTVLLGLIDDLLDFAHIESGRLRIAHVEFDLHAVFDGIHAAYAKEAERKGIAFEVAFGNGAGGRYRGDSARLRQIACNLISNALKFTASGRVRVEVEDLRLRSIAPDGARHRHRHGGVESWSGAAGRPLSRPTVQ